MAWEEALNKVKDKETRDKLQEFHSRASMLVLSQLVLSPGLLITLTPLIVVFVVLRTQWTTLRTIYNYTRETIPMALLEEEAANS